MPDDVSDFDLGGDGQLHRRDAPATLVWRLEACGNEPVQARWHRARIRTACWRFYIVDRPGLHLEWAGGALTYDVDAITVIPAWLPFTFFTAPGVVHAFVHAEIPSLGQALTAALWPHPWSWRDAPALQRFRAWARALARCAADDPRPAQEAQALAALGLAEAIAHLDPAARRRALPAPGHRLDQVVAAIARDLGKPLPVPHLARLAGLGVEPFIRLFRRTYGMTPVQYILHQRCARAAGLLAGGDLPLDAIAARCGFPSRQYLSRMFVRRYAMPPAAYRRRHRGGQPLGTDATDDAPPA
ncbi:MAG: AraC family transcriptional regulator [Planctomycetes bacterium]|nr:AraC family transcriptional regulator [Planctomycetota bacterium]